MRSKYFLPLLWLTVLFFFLQKEADAQSKFKLGIGGTLISNDGENPNFNAFIAPTTYLAYSFVRQQNLSVSVENTFSFRSTEDGFLHADRNGFAMALPVAIEYRLARLSIAAGAGPAYVKQRLVGEGNSTIDRVGGLYGDINGGLGLSLKQSPNASINLRFHYLKGLSNKQEDGAMLSLYLAFGSK